MTQVPSVQIIKLVQKAQLVQESMGCKAHEAQGVQEFRSLSCDSPDLCFPPCLAGGTGAAVLRVITALYCTLLHSPALLSTVIYCTVQHCILLYSTSLYSTTFYSTLLYCTKLHFTVIYCTVQHCNLLYSSVVYCNALN